MRIALPRSVGTATPTYASSSAIANKLKLQRRCDRPDVIDAMHDERSGFRIRSTRVAIRFTKYARIYVMCCQDLSG